MNVSISKLLLHKYQFYKQDNDLDSKLQLYFIMDAIIDQFKIILVSLKFSLHIHYKYTYANMKNKKYSTRHNYCINTF